MSRQSITKRLIAALGLLGFTLVAQGTEEVSGDWKMWVEPVSSESWSAWRSIAAHPDWEPCKNGDLCIGTTTITQVLVGIGEARPIEGAPDHIAEAPTERAMDASRGVSGLSMELDGKLYAPMNMVQFFQSNRFFQISGAAATQCGQVGPPASLPESDAFAVINNRIVRLLGGAHLITYRGEDAVFVLNSSTNNIACGGRLNLRARAFGPGRIAIQDTAGSIWTIRLDSFHDTNASGALTINIPNTLQLVSAPASCTGSATVTCNIDAIEPGESRVLHIALSAATVGHGYLTCTADFAGLEIEESGCGIAIESFFQDDVFVDRFES